MKKHFAFFIVLLLSCNTKKNPIIRKIPCDDVINFNNVGTLHGKHLTQFCAVDYDTDSIPIKQIRQFVDSLFEQTDIIKYPGFVCWFLKESSALKRIKNCDIADGQNLISDQNKLLVLYTYDASKKSLQEVHYGKNGSVTYQLMIDQFSDGRKAK